MCIDGKVGSFCVVLVIIRISIFLFLLFIDYPFSVFSFSFSCVDCGLFVVDNQEFLQIVLGSFFFFHSYIHSKIDQYCI